MNMKQKILILGGGGREHAIGWRIKEDHPDADLFFAPGNGGTAALGTNLPIPVTDIPKLVDFAEEESIDLTLAIPDDPLSLGIVDAFEEKGLRIFGPRKAAAELEWSKAYAKSFMSRNRLPTAAFKTFISHDEALSYARNGSLPIVIKASGLALGKGVYVCRQIDEAEIALKEIMLDKRFGQSGNEVVIEEFLEGPEASIHAFCDGKTAILFPPSRDHKTIGEGGTGPNTGGMGTISPLDDISIESLRAIEGEIVQPAIVAMKEEGRPFKGILFPGLMMTDEGPKLLEFNARFGDPETQTYMRLFEGDLLSVFESCIDGTLSADQVRWAEGYACTIVLASEGYPGAYEKGKEISGIEEAESDSRIKVFHAGTALEEGRLVTNGGRVLGVTATDRTMEEALDAAYAAADKIQFDGKYMRRDIGRA